jgi:hypothetical protein
MLDQCYRVNRAISLNDGGRTGGESLRVQITARSRFVLRIRRAASAVVAGWIVVSAFTSVTAQFSAHQDLDLGRDRRLFQEPSGLCASAASGGADTGSVQASYRAQPADSLPNCPRLELTR